MKTDITFTKKQKRKITFYAVITLSLAIAGAISYVSTYRTVKNAQNDVTLPIEITIPTTESTTIAYDEQVNFVKDDIPDERYEEDEQVNAQENIKAVVRAESFSLPLGNTISKHASLSDLVFSKTMEDWRVHNGVDFSGATGDPVKAVNNGIVISVKDDALWGTVVEIDHGEGMIARYCGLGKGSTVNEGDTININDKVGNLSVIPIESADGVHLHFEVLQDNKFVDPLSAIGKTAEDFN